ncbi:MAG: deoxyribonuclease IV [Gemmatimonadetes bacterium]|nr:deoxyribonuclease IV [Gemmatimonadota bacterium]
MGAHVSTAGGVQRAPERAAAIESVVVQVFTKQPNRWAEPACDAELAAAFRAERATHGIVAVASHDSYLINLASPDPVLFERSYASFRMELERCVALGIEYVVTHPGNATDGDVDHGLAQNAEAIERALEAVGGGTQVLLETTAGSGRVLGASFEQLATMRERIREPLRARVGICFDTCHVWAAGYDLVGDYDGVMARFEDVLGLDTLRLFHLNDSVGGHGSRRDRHAGIGEGTLGEAPFRRLMTDERFLAVPKVLETPKGEDLVTLDRLNLGRLRRYRAEG